jgi:hypothetical protein
MCGIGVLSENMQRHSVEGSEGRRSERESERMRTAKNIHMLVYFL